MPHYRPFRFPRLAPGLAQFYQGVELGAGGGAVYRLGGGLDAVGDVVGGAGGQ